ncbi:hypothetical protein Rumeso_01362 [Rubellimicrobium mesophilum DSM 19309]|uniref:Uncharacterized protein n=1 Tax=Rubellimicrobium mesophilum DSM 19309 TaxID=442562 RepID=A0A017HSJ6_9RHOB|nr:hypothetical protein [Rubellimicrobium mesophilum]EYD77103.1 hypothetical protein Rumeso_01362 [Rubellimicrobium mesophilum DSM 19309]
MAPKFLLNFTREELRQIYKEEVVKAHGRIDAYYERAQDATIQSGQHAIRALFLINGGAIVALLAFLSSLASGGGFESRVHLFALPLLTFAQAVVAVAVGYGAVYFTNYSSAKCAETMVKSYEIPHYSESPTSLRWRIAANFFQGAALGASVGSLGLFVAGVLQIRDAITAF